MKRTLILLVAVLMIPAGMAFAQPGNGHPRGVCDGSGPMMGGGHGMMNCDGPGMGRGRGMGRGMGMGQGMGVQMLLRNADEIGLTDDQKAKLTDMSTRFQTERIDKEAELEKAQVQLRALMMNDDARQADVLAGIDTVTKLKGDLQKMQYTHRTTVRDLLTQEQRDKIKTMWQDRMQDRRNGRNDQRGMGMGMRHGMQDDD